MLGDDTLIHYIEPQMKIDNNMWLTKKTKRPVIAKRRQSTGKVIIRNFI